MKYVPGIVFSGLLLSASLAEAQVTTFNCREQAGETSPQLTLAYEGDARGTLTVKASFGELSLRFKQNPTDDEDIRFMHVLACQEKAEQRTQAPITATIMVSITDPPAAEVSVNRTYVEPSAVTGKRIAMETFPAGCTMVD